MTEPPHARQGGRRPAARPSHTPERILAIAAVSGLLIVGIVSLVMIVGAASGGDDEEQIAAAPSPTATPEPTPTPKPTPTPVPLTAAQKADRRAAAEVVESRGFEVVRLRDYDPRKTLRVLIGKQTSGDARMAFFFVNGDYIGNDSTDPSAELKLVRAGDLRVTLAYGIYAPGDPAGDPSGGPVKVRFKWDGASLVPQDPLPPAEQRTPGRQAA